MASFSSPSSQSKNSVSFNITCLLIILFLLVASCAAARPGRVVTLMVEGHNKASMEPETVKPHRRLYKMGFIYEGQMFNFFPKGTPMPPSGPSKKHNSVQN